MTPEKAAQAELPRPFHCGSQAGYWMETNCERCRKGCPDDVTPSKCEILIAINEAWWGDGTVPEAIAERMGYLDNSPPRQRGWSYNWRCTEFEAKEQA